MNTKEAFLDQIRENPLDPDIRQIFADWLEENDEPDLADFYRDWSLAKHHESEQWLRNYAGGITRAEAYGYADEGPPYSPSYAQAEDYEPYVTYEQVIEAGHEQLDGLNGKYPDDTSWNFPDRPLFLPFDIPDFVYDQRKEFWRHFSIVTGRYIPKKDYGATLFHCSC